MRKGLIPIASGRPPNDLVCPHCGRRGRRKRLNCHGISKCFAEECREGVSPPPLFPFLLVASPRFAGRREKGRKGEVADVDDDNDDDALASKQVRGNFLRREATGKGGFSLAATQRERERRGFWVIVGVLQPPHFSKGSKTPNTRQRRRRRRRTAGRRNLRSGRCCPRHSLLLVHLVLHTYAIGVVACRSPH